MLERYEELSVGESPAADQSNPWIGPGLITIVFGLLTLWSWRRWPDLLVDFGRELYSPWQLAGGKLLYRDVASLFGPFSQYFNAVGFRLFGVSFTTLIVCNMAILAGITAITYRLFAACLNRFTATAVSIVFLAMFGFSEYTIIGNYNFISPYSHETTHGVACALLMIYAFQRWLQRGLLWWAFLAGSCLGISLLTKPEIAMAAAASAVTGVILIAGAVTERRCPALRWPLRFSAFLRQSLSSLHILAPLCRQRTQDATSWEPGYPYSHAPFSRISSICKVWGSMRPGKTSREWRTWRCARLFSLELPWPSTRECAAPQQTLCD